MKDVLERQADVIDAALMRRGLLSRVTGGTITPRQIRYQALPVPVMATACFSALEDELAAALGASVRVRLRGAALAVEVDRDDPRPVPLRALLRGLHNVPPLTAVLGIAEDGAPLLVHLSSPDVRHVFIAGVPKCGKTALLRVMLISLAHFTPGVSFVAVGEALRNLPRLARPAIAEPAEAVEALGSLARLVENRIRRNGQEPTFRVLAIDELVDLLQEDAAREPLARLLDTGPQAGVHVLAATRRPTAAVIGNEIRKRFPARIVGHVESAAEAGLATGLIGTGAERLLGPGDFIAVVGGQVHHFQAAWEEAGDAGGGDGSTGRE